MIKRILVTGHEGYLGSVMAPYLAGRGFEVCGLDTGFFRDCNLVKPQGGIPNIDKDLRELEASDLRDFDAIVHLAALSNDPIGNLNKDWTVQINVDGTVRLARMAKEAGVQRFLFSSSCIMYGMTSENVEATEESPLDPKTTYAWSKVEAERAILELADRSFSPTFLRNGTVYGLSPRMRFDLVLNDLMGSAVTTGVVSVRGNGLPWRPLLHVGDVAKAFEAVLAAPREAVHAQAFNVGAEHLNARVINIAEQVALSVPGSRLEVQSNPDADQRTYRASFAKFDSTFPGFAWRSIEEGARQLSEEFKGIGLDEAMYRDRRFIRLKWLGHLLDSKRLDGSLRWRSEVKASR